MACLLTWNGDWGHMGPINGDIVQDLEAIAVSDEALPVEVAQVRVPLVRNTAQAKAAWEHFTLWLAELCSLQHIARYSCCMELCLDTAMHKNNYGGMSILF